MTYRDYDDLVTRYNDRLWREQYLPFGLQWVILANAHRNSKVRPTAFALRDYPLAAGFLEEAVLADPQWSAQPSGKDLFAKMVALTKAFGGTIEVDRPIADN